MLTSVAGLIVALDQLVVATALDTIHRDLGASMADLEWTVNAFGLGFAALLVPAAELGDRIGRKRAYLSGLVLFALASAACALAPTTGYLVAARAVQGAAGALLEPAHLAQEGVVETLHAHRQARHAGGAQGGEEVGPQVVRVGLHRDLAHAETGAQLGERGQQFGRFHRRRAAAEGDAVEGVAGVVVEDEFAAQGREIAGRPPVLVRHAVEGAERAERLAERHVHVEVAVAQRGRRRHRAGRLLQRQEALGAESEKPQEQVFQEDGGGRTHRPDSEWPNRVTKAYTIRASRTSPIPTKMKPSVR